MNSNINRRIPFLRYFPKSVKFYELRNEKISAFIFVILLLINFCTSLLLSRLSVGVSIDSSQVLPDDITAMFAMLVKIGSLSVLSTLLMTIFSSFYVYAFIRDLRGIPYTLKDCLSYTGARLFPIIVLSVIISLAVSIGSMLLVIPGIILYIMFIFSVQFMLDQNKGIFSALKASVNLTKGFKMGIFNAVLLINLLILIFPTFAESGKLVVPFVSAFISTIFNIVFQRFVTLIYYDLEYIRKPKNIDINV